jgi:hypothetical protein
VVHFASASAISGANAFGLRSGGAELVDSRYAIIACSSPNIPLNTFAKYVASEEDEDELEGTWFGV